MESLEFGGEFFGTKHSPSVASLGSVLLPTRESVTTLQFPANERIWIEHQIISNSGIWIWKRRRRRELEPLEASSIQVARSGLAATAGRASTVTWWRRRARLHARQAAAHAHPVRCAYPCLCPARISIYLLHAQWRR